MTGASLTIGRWLSDRARRRRTASRSDPRRRADVRGARRARDELAAGLARARASGTATGSRRCPTTRRSSRRLLRVREGRARPACRSRGGCRRPRSPTSSTTRSRRCFLVAEEHGSSPTRPSSRRRTGAPSSRRPGRRRSAPRDDPLLLIYTSGTTGKPKGALLTHANCFWTNLSLRPRDGLRDDDVVLQVLPQFHSAAGTCSRCSPGGRARRSCSSALRRGARARADRGAAA